MKKIGMLWLLLLAAGTVMAQEAFSYTPQNPKPGDVITITYEPSGMLLGTIKPVEAVYYMAGYAPGGAYRNIDADNLKLARQGKKYTGTIKADTAAAFIFFGFSADKNFDNNNNNGYYILLNDGEKPRKGAHTALSFFYQFDGPRVGLERDPEKGMEALQKELALYPESKKDLLPMYVRMINSTKKEEAPALVQKEIEAFLKTGLKTEEDYQLLQNLYASGRMPEQAKLVANLIKEKFPQGKWTINDKVNLFMREQDAAKKRALFDEIARNVKTDEAWKHMQGNLDFFQQMLLTGYIEKKDWAGLKKALEETSFSSDEQKASFFNNTAWAMQKDSSDLALAESLSRFATEWAKKEYTKPAGKKPPYLTSSQWLDSRKNSYGMYADTYAMIMYRMGQYKKGLPYAKEAALTIHNGKDAEQNNTYALLAEKALPLKQYKSELEGFVKSGKATPEIKEVLRRAYAKQKGSEAGFDDYITALQKESYLQMVADLQKKMLNETAPAFALLDLDGNKIDMADLKGKVVIADFWATWCGPCIASFPAMQKIVNKYKANDKVKFVFINTWENAEDKKKNAADFIAKSGYNFLVLMDNEDKVVTQFKVEGIPTKFVIDGNGVIRFKSVGFNASEDVAIAELDAMIELAAKSGSKAF